MRQANGFSPSPICIPHISRDAALTLSIQVSRTIQPRPHSLATSMVNLWCTLELGPTLFAAAESTTPDLKLELSMPHIVGAAAAEKDGVAWGIWRNW